MARILIINSIFILFSAFLNAQQAPTSKKSYFISPLEIPLYLSGNFGELRSTHFHAGIDLKTQATEGHNVLACAEGYISRIKIQTGGYGRALYIAHPNGLTTVYGHLQVYAPKIEKYIKDYQYRNKTHTVDIYLKSNEIQVEKGEIIALSGNTGSSGGPHLHFEIRETSTQNPRNGLLYNFDIKDNIPPQIRGVSIYPLNEKSFINSKNKMLIVNTTGSYGNYKLTNNALSVYGNIGFGIETYDYLNGSNNRCGIYSIEMRIDDETAYYHEMSSFSFTETSYIHSHVDYKEWKNSSRRFQKTFRDPNNHLSLYHKTLKKSGYEFKGDTNHIVEFIIKDSYQNTSRLEFNLEVKPTTVLYVDKSSQESNTNKSYSYNSVNYFNNEEINLVFPKGALFDDINFEYTEEKNPHSSYSGLHLVHNIFTPLNKRFQIKIKPENLSRRLWNKATLIRIDEENEKDVISSKFQEGYVVGSSKAFGSFYVDVDTLSPIITPLNVYSRANLSGNQYISFRAIDDLTGIDSYDGYIDNKWALFEYDPKNDLIRYYFDNERLERGKMHQLELYVIDAKNNVGTYSVEFYW